MKIFHLPEENYDAWAVFAALAVRSIRNSLDIEWQLAFELATEFYRELFPNDDERQSFDQQLGIENSVERSLYARTRLLPEFLD